MRKWITTATLLIVTVAVAQHTHNHAVADNVRQQGVELVRGTQFECPIATLLALTLLAKRFGRAFALVCE